MRFSVWPSPTRSWSEVVAVVERCDETGWDGAYVADHFMPNDPQGRPQDGPELECWSVLAALAARTRTLRLGPLVSGNLYRHPAVVANAAVAIDHVSRGRFVLGLGAGWQVNEHTAYGIDLPDTKARLDRFEEACEVVTSLLRRQRTTFHGRHYRLTDAPCDPTPVGPLPLLVGGGGEKRTLRIAARFADEWNTWSTPDTFRHKVDVLQRHCEAVGRDPTSIRHSTQAFVFLSRDESVLAPLRTQDAGRPVVVGTPAEVVERLAAYRDAGVDEFIVPDWTMGPVGQAVETLDLFGAEVAPHLR